MATMTSTGAAGGTAGAEAAEAGRGAAWRACGDLHIGVRGAEQAQPTAARARYGSMHIYELQLSRAQSSTVHVHDGRTILLTHADKDGHFVFELGDNLTSRCEWSLHCISAARHVLSGCPV